ncbi:multidrug resistance-associated ABC transporter [Epithele typhae]|uniref:multidrug resistance-associated ABC transporter n=1 Tax=Epithele typhae TaxID=378194 RepID=UPI0020076DCE|nr:multidrug resistance-associated ABC transporter [Epithele typhae]KAH9929009.1 multidrug resistance-associated ABC transporter [Epithele typhae]
MKTARLACCVALATLSAVPLVLASRRTLELPASLEYELVHCGLYIYASALAVGHLLSRKHSSAFASHLVIVTFLALAVSAGRNVVPLFVIGGVPADLATQGVLLWAKIVLLFEISVMIPLVLPHYDPSIPNPNDEQRSSLLAYCLFAWLDVTISKASRTSHLSHNELPSLAEDNRARSLVERSFSYIDPLKVRSDRHIIWGLLLFYPPHGSSQAVVPLATPIALRNLLNVLETGGEHSRYEPWTWIVLMFIGSSISTLADQWYIWIVHRQHVKTQVILTELIFQHALRIRVKAETSAADGSTARSANLSGRLNNLVTSDIENLKVANHTAKHLLAVIKWPLQMIAAVLLLYRILGWSIFVGIGAMFIMLPFPTYVTDFVRKYQAMMMVKMDARVQLISETLGIVRMIKLFAWEHHVAEKITRRRDEELVELQNSRMMILLSRQSTFSIPLLVMLLTFASFALLQKGELTPSRVFPALSAFIMLQNLQLLFGNLPSVLRGKLSIDRINDFLHETELLDEFEDPPVPGEDRFIASDADIDIGINHTHFTWSSSVPGSGAQTPVDPTSSTTPDLRRFSLRIDEPLRFKRGAINLIIGPTGSGKTSLLMALLGEMHARPSEPGVGTCVKLPRDGGVAYAAQESWIQSETIRDNILFGLPFDEVRYKMVIKQCALERDLALFAAGDMTEVGERGITLSGGQKARITLARAVYSKAEILLLDDVLAALDVQTGRSIVDQCFMGDLVRNRTVILVSHNVALTRPIAGFVVALGSNGRIASQGSLDKALEDDQELMEELKADVNALVKADQDLDSQNVADGTAEQSSNGKLFAAEEISRGTVGWDTMRLYFLNASRSPWIFWLTYPTLIALTHSMFNLLEWVLGLWASQYETHERSEVHVGYYVSYYLGVLLAGSTAYAIGWYMVTMSSLRVSTIVHQQLIKSVLGTTLRWLDKTPTSRIVARCTADIHTVDTAVYLAIHHLTEHTVFMLTKLVAVTVVIPVFVIPAALFAAISSTFSRSYMRAELPIKREMSNAQAPVLGHFSGAMAGLVSIRAYGAQEAFKLESYRRLDYYSRAAFPFNALTRWITVRVNLLGIVLTTALATYLTYVASIGAASTGFSMSMASKYCMAYMFHSAHFPDYLHSVERIRQYLEIEQEPKSTKSGVPPAYWPASGELRVENLSARYTPDGPKVLHDLSFQVKSGERIGIVGRTGSGKSSLTLSLLRAIYTEGSVFYDGLATDALNLDALRSNVTIIPQVPDLLSGTLRQNLDLYDEYSDVTLNDALRSAGLFALQERGTTSSSDGHIDGGDGARLTLDSEIAGGGGNLSVGQRQIIALARAIVRRSKLLILDEGVFSSHHYETDAIIQKSLREELGKDVTVLTVAHRLQSIMDADKIMVLDAGRIVEFDSPSILLGKSDGYFRGLVDGSLDRHTLYAMTGATA